MPNTPETIERLAKQLERKVTLYSVLELAQESGGLNEPIEKLKVLIRATDNEEQNGG